VIYERHDIVNARDLTLDSPNDTLWIPQMLITEKLLGGFVLFIEYWITLAAQYSTSNFRIDFHYRGRAIWQRLSMD
jgi:hypothetical protein